MTDENVQDALEATLRRQYVQELRTHLGEFAVGLGLNATEMEVHLDAVSRLFVRYESWPAYSAWREKALRSLPKANGSHEAAAAAEPARPVLDPGDTRRRMESKELTTREYGKLAAWAEVHKPNAVFQGRNGRPYLSKGATWTDAEIQEAMR